MASELQVLVDNLGDRLGRSVAIDDKNIRLLAYNAHTGEVDEARRKSIMQREVPRELVAYFQGIGLYDAGGLFKVPVRPELGIAIERTGMPVRFNGALLGFLWLLGSDGPITDDEANAVGQAAEHAGQILHREHLLDELRLGRVREHARDLLSASPRLQHAASQRLIEEGLLIAGPVTSLVVTIPHDIDHPLSERERIALAVGLENGCRRAPPRSAIHLERVDHGVVIAVSAEHSTGREIDDLATAVHDQVCAASGCAPADCHVGIGDHRADLTGVHESYTEAWHAATVARVVGVLGSIVRYSGLGVYGLLGELPLDRLRRSLHPGLQRLREKDSDHAILTPTLEEFLTNAGDVKRTAANLGVHRASVHYRLHRVEEIAQVDLSSGDDRLALHLGLKITRLVKAPLTSEAE